MPKDRKWDAQTLISLVEKHPCIWDRTEESYRIKARKQRSWDEVFRAIEEDFDNLPEREQTEIGCTMISKWNNIRDAFVRSMKYKDEDGRPKRKYIYHSNLHFLMKVFDKENESKPSIVKSCDNETSEYEIKPHHTIKRMKIEENEPKERKNEQNEKPLDEDELFFASVLPAVKKFSEEDKYEFRISMLKLIQDIRRRKVSKQEIFELCIPSEDGMG